MPFRLKQYSAIITILLILFALLSSVSPVPTAAARKAAPVVDPAALQREAVAALKLSDFNSAEAKLRELQTGAPRDFTANNLDYSLARIDQREGKPAPAQPLFEAVVARGGNLAPYALFHLAQLARARGDGATERGYLERLLKLNHSTALTRLTQERLGQNYLEAKNYVFGITLLKPLSGTATPATREILARIGAAYMEAGDTATARTIFNQLVNASRDDSALAAVKALDQLDEQSSHALTEVEQLSRGRICMFNRDFPVARQHFTAFVEQFPTGKSMPEVLYQIGRSYYLEYNYDEAIKWYDRVHDQFPASDEGELGYYHVGHALQKAGRYLDAVRRYDVFLKAYPDSQWLPGAHLNAVDSLRSAMRPAEALVWVNRTINNPKLQHDVAVTTAIFDEAKISLTEKDYRHALDLFTQLLARNLRQTGPGSTDHDEVAFMRGYCLEQLGRIPEAVTVYLSLPDERDKYYGHRASLRLQALAASDQGAQLQRRATQSAAEAESANRAGNAVAAKTAADLALRLSADDALRRRMLETLHQSYEHLQGYSAPFSYHVTPLGREWGQPTTEASHQALARELIFLGMYDEAAAELAAQNARADLAVPSVGESSIMAELDDFDLGGKVGQLAPDSVANNLDDANDINDNSAGARYRLTPVSQSRSRTVRASQSTSEGGSGAAVANAYSLAVYYNQGDRADKAIAYGEPLFKSLPKDYHLEVLPRDFAELNYPAPYRLSLRRHGGERQVDPRIILALARQESRFDPTAKSPAAARGLLQFIPDTASKIAGELQLTRFDQTEIYNPDTAILFGAQYVKDLLILFPDNPAAVAASYNGGEDNVQRWRDRSQSTDVDRLVIELGYHETKDYVYKVMSNYWAYQAIYGPDLK